MNLLTNNFQENINNISNLLNSKNNFDLLHRDINIGNKKGVIYFVDGLIKDDVMEKIMEYLMSMTKEKFENIKCARDFSNSFIPYIETDVVNNIDEIITSILSGTLVLLVEGFNEAIYIDARTYPSRSIQEPEEDKVLRGSHEGFIEMVIANTALIRRRIRDRHLTMQALKVGKESKTDIILCYMENKVDKKCLKELTKKIESISINALTLSQESLMECLMRQQWYNPFPKVRYSERPDSVASCVLEGKIAILIDNSPSAIIVPTSFFDFFENTNDFCFPPLIGTYLRSIRMILFTLTLFLTPLWYLILKNPNSTPAFLQFLNVKGSAVIPLLSQLLIVDFMLDGLKLASLNTPSSLSNSFSIVGALILGEFAVTSGWFEPQVVLYMAFIAIAGFTQPSFEMGYSFKVFRILTLILTAAFNLLGFIIGMIIFLIVLCTTKTVTGHSYLYPLIPFNFKKLLRLIIRMPIDNENC